MFDILLKKQADAQLRSSKARHDGLDGMYEIPSDHKKKIVEFLKKHKYLYPILKEAKPQIVSVFGENVRIGLELHHDPEEGWDELFIVIKSSYSPEEAIGRENRLAEEWFLNRMKATRGKLNIVEEPL